MRVQRENVRDVLVRPHHDEGAAVPVDAAQVEDVDARVGAERLLVVDELERALAGEEDPGQARDGELAVPLLEDRARLTTMCGISETSSSTSSMGPVRTIELGSSGSGRQKVTSLPW